MRALLHTTDKTGIAKLGRGLSDLGWEITSTTGTGRVLSEAGIPVVPIEELIGVPAMMGGRVKTLHLKVFGGLLYRRDVQEHRMEVERYDIPPIDLMACNFYRFVETIKSGNPTPDEAMEKIDIGGPATIRAAAKNCRWVIPLVDPGDYDSILAMLRAANGSPEGVSLKVRRALAAKVFEYTRGYDDAIAAYVRSLGDLPERAESPATQ